MKSRSLWFGQARQIELREEELGSPGDHDILVAALYSGISHGTEMLVYRGEAPRYLTVDPSVDTMEGSFGFPIKFGYSSVGQVAKRGPGVTGLRCGDTVFVHHPHQSHYVVPQQLAFKLPPNLSPVLGVFASNLETAVNCLHDADIKLGDV
ncbi:MAG: zinc-binding alcohol dehydrogenase, partial [Chloroflexota bacterium]